MYLVDGQEVGTQFWISDNYYREEGNTATGTDRWHYCVATYDGNNARIYLDGELDSISGTVSGTIDIEEEINKLQEELNYTKGFLKSIQGKLSNERFVSNAPEKVVAIERKKEADALAKIETITRRLESLN